MRLLLLPFLLPVACFNRATPLSASCKSSRSRSRSSLLRRRLQVGLRLGPARASKKVQALGAVRCAAAARPLRGAWWEMRDGSEVGFRWFFWGDWSVPFMCPFCRSQHISTITSHSLLGSGLGFAPLRSFECWHLSSGLVKEGFLTSSV